MRTIAIVNQKGGCGKTTTAINLAGVLARFGERTLLVDLDPQSHCAAGLAIPEDRIELHIGDAMLADSAASGLYAADGTGGRDPQPSNGSSAIDETRLLWRIRKNLDLAPSGMTLAGLEAARGGLADLEDREERLRKTLDAWRSRYDVCLIDCPPSIGLLTFNALRAADEVLIPVETGFFSLQGAGRQINTIRSLARRLGGATPYHLLVTMHDEKSVLANDLLAELRRRFVDRVLPVVIRLDGSLKDAASMGQPVIEFAPASAGAQDYSDLAAWLLGQPVPVQDDYETAPLGSEAIERERFRPRSRPASAIEPKPLAEVRLRDSDSSILARPTPAEDPIASRAAELAQRARQLLERGAQLQAKLRADPDVSRMHGLLEHTQPEPIVQRASDARTGPIETPHGVVFRHRATPDTRVAIAGEFNRWSPSATPMRYNAVSGLHEAQIALPPGRCEYRLVVDGVWIADPSNPSMSVNPFGETNSVLVVTMPSRDYALTEGAD